MVQDLDAKSDLILKAIASLDKKIDGIDIRLKDFEHKTEQHFIKIETKLTTIEEESVRLREDVTGLQNEKFEIKRIK
jgi:hypothetical protein